MGAVKLYFNAMIVSAGLCLPTSWAQASSKKSINLLKESIEWIYLIVSLGKTSPQHSYCWCDYGVNLSVWWAGVVSCRWGRWWRME